MLGLSSMSLELNLSRTIGADVSADFECGECHGGKCGGEQPETYDDLGLAPAHQVEVMVDGSASEESFSAGVLEIADLQDYAD